MGRSRLFYKRQSIPLLALAQMIFTVTSLAILPLNTGYIDLRTESYNLFSSVLIGIIKNKTYCKEFCTGEHVS